MKKENKKEEDWLQRKWRPMMALMYMIVCIFDFILFPIMFTSVQFWETEAVNDAFRQWQPITLLGGGLFHVAMGAVLGVTAWSRGQEKIAGASNNNVPQSKFTPQESMPLPQIMNHEPIQTPMMPVNQGVIRAYGGKKAPPPAYEPEI